MSTAAAAAQAIPLSFRDVLRIPVMRRVWYAQVISLFGDFLALFAVIAVVSFRMHGTAAQLTGLQIAYMLPIVFVGPIAGVFVDRWPLKPTLVSSDLLRAGLALLLIPATTVWQVFVVLAALSCVSAFFRPAQTVTIRSHVPTPGLMSANALMQIAFMGSRIVGPATGRRDGRPLHAEGVLRDRRGELPGVGRPDRVGSRSSGRSSLLAPSASSTNRIHAIWLDMVAGMRFIVHHGAILFFVIAMAAGLFTIGCFGPLISLYVRDTLHASAGVFGYVSGMVGVGLLLGTQVIRIVARKASDTGLVLWGLLGIGAGVLLLGAVPHIAATLAATFAIGFAFSAIMVPAQTLIQRETPPDMLGRVGSTNASVIFLGQILGLAVSGVLAEIVGVRTVFFLCAALSVALAAAGRVFLRSNRQPTA